MHATDISSLVTRLQADDEALPAYLDTMEARFDRLEPTLHAFVPEDGRFARLRREAAALAARHPTPAERPRLYGILVGVKDIFHVDGFTTRAGTAVPAELLRGHESAAVSALRAAGALVLGKTITTEFAYFAPGPTRHPLSDTLGRTFTPGGSSSGSAAAVAAGLCPLALGTQTIGSITRPAAFCGIAGYKPSYGRIDTAGVLPLAPSADTVGFFTRQAADIAGVAAVLVADWQSPKPAEALPVLGIPIGPYLDRTPVATREHLRAVADQLQAAGYTVRNVSALTDFEAIYLWHNQLVAAEAAAVHAVIYDVYGDRYHPKTAELIERGRGVGAADYEAALDSRLMTRAALEKVMDEAGIDVWLSPAALGPALPGLDSTGDPVMNLPWTHAGLPTVALPAGQERGLPLGIQLAARFRADEALVGWAAHLAATLESLEA